MMPNNPSGSDGVRHVFVYGTLRRGEANDINHQRPAPAFVGAATVRGWMYELGWYPGLVLATPGQDAPAVVGEVYAITRELERVLDEIEEIYPQQRDEYFKREMDVALSPAPGTRDAVAPLLRCVVYEINPKYLAGRPLIAGGDWVRRTKA